MKYLLLITNAFFRTMGITKPSPQAEKRAAWFLLALLSLVFIAIIAILVLAIRMSPTH